MQTATVPGPAKTRRPRLKQVALFADEATTKRPLILDYFAGGGGASTGIEWALGRSPDVAINHCEHAVQVHALNHPRTDHLKVDVWDVDPRKHIPAGDVDLAWFSPSCTHFSRAKGGTPVSKQLRGQGWIVCRVAGTRRPRVIVLENVAEFRTWGPVRKGRPVKSKVGTSYHQFMRQLRALGYTVEDRILNASDYGAPTHRKRLVLIARCDGEPIVWPEATHGPGRPLPYRTAAECIDWSIPTPSIFGRKRPLAEATQKRIAEGLRRFLLECPRPFIVPVKTHGGGGNGPRRIDAPMPTITASKRGEFALVTTWLAKHYGGVVGHLPDRPIGTITAVDHHSVVACKLFNMKEMSDGLNGSDGRGDSPRGDEGRLGGSSVESHGRSSGTVAPEAGASANGAGAEARVSRRSRVVGRKAVPCGGASLGLDRVAGTDPGGIGHQPPGREQGEQQPQQPGIGHQEQEHPTCVRHGAAEQDELGQGVGAKGEGSPSGGQDVRGDREVAGRLSDDSVQGCRLVAAFLTKFYSSGPGAQSVSEPLHTIVTKARFGVVTVTIAGEEYAIVDIGLRMLTPRELARAQGFSDDFVLVGSQADQVARIGNSVSPPMAQAVVAANVASKPRKVAPKAA